MKTDTCKLTDKGRKRKHNEDCSDISRDQQLVVVCDGMGGHNAGEVASRTAVDTIISSFYHLQQSEIDKLCPDVTPLLEDKARRIIAAIRLANYQIFTMSRQNVEQMGMGTTVVVLYLDDNYFIAAHVGDSRIYRFRNENLKQLTKDHSWYAEMKEETGIAEKDLEAYGKRNVITRAVGIEQTVRIDILIESLTIGDRFLLCTDGLTVPVSDETICRILREFKINEEAANQLIKSANLNGGPDNITVALVTISDMAEGIAPERLETIIKKSESDTIAEADGILERLAGLSGANLERPKKKTRRPFTYIALVLFFMVFVVIFRNFLCTEKPVDKKETTGIPGDSTGVIHPGTPIKQEIEPMNYSTIYLLTFNQSIKDSAAVFLDNEFKGLLASLPERQLQVPDGLHQIKVQWPGKFEITVEITAQNKSEHTIAIDDTLTQLEQKGKFKK